jgi:putative integral membrane protein (TIGR02587 family)
MRQLQHNSTQDRYEATRRFGIGVARAYAGAILFSLPLLMTMEMWWLGFSMGRGRLALLLGLMLPLLIGLAHQAGFEATVHWRHAVLSAGVAYAVAFSAAAGVLALLAIIGPGMSADEILGKIALQAVPGSLGALLARSQLGIQHSQAQGHDSSTQYAGELFLMAIGALFLAFNVAPTQEMVLIAYKMTRWQALGLAIVSLGLMHAFVYVMEFQGQEPIPTGLTFWQVFLRFTVAGYAVVLLVSVYMLWTFGRLDGASMADSIMVTVVLGFPAALGAAAARLML